MSIRHFAPSMRFLSTLKATLLLVAITSSGEAADTAPVTKEVVVVGGSLGWAVPPNHTYYADWIKGLTFHVGDTLRFNWTLMHTVANVSKADYDSCNTKVSTLESTAAPPGTVGKLVYYNITKPADTLYFICTVGPHCQLGQKVNVHVEAGGGATAGGSSPDAETPAPKSSAPLAFMGVLSTTLSYWAFVLFVF